MGFVTEFWHWEYVCGRTEKAFVNKYQQWCRKNGYNFSEENICVIYYEANRHIGVMTKPETIKLLVEQAVSQLRATSAALKQEMQELSSQLPEYPAVMEIFGPGATLGPQLIDEIGDVCRFYSKMVCRDFILPEFCKPCLLLFTQLILQYYFDQRERGKRASEG